jgi:hypothetical protein
MEMSDLAKEVERQIELLEMPVDFDALCAEGVLMRKGKRFKVLDARRLPEHVSARISGADSNGMCTIRKTEKAAARLRAKFEKLKREAEGKR